MRVAHQKDFEADSRQILDRAAQFDALVNLGIPYSRHLNGYKPYKPATQAFPFTNGESQMFLGALLVAQQVKTRLLIGNHDGYT